MMAVTVDMKVVKQFFDRDKVLRAMDAKTRRAMSKAGAFIRRRARSSLRRRKRPSTPPEPPSVHSNDRFHTLKNILFFYEPDTQSLIVGPVQTTRTGPVPVPSLHEFGGTTTIKTRARRGRPAKRKRASYPPRRFMGPALAAELAAGTIPRQWAGPLGSVSVGP